MVSQLNTEVKKNEEVALKYLEGQTLAELSM